jgi:hypothetical protein
LIIKDERIAGCVLDDGKVSVKHSNLIKHLQFCS